MTGSKKIFISRSLTDDSPIRKVAQHIIHDQSLISFSPLPFDAPEADWVFFYSRNAVRFFFEFGDFELYPYQYACMSNGTAEELSQFVLDISFIGEGRPEDVANQFQNERKPYEKVCFIRANNSVDSIFKLVGTQNDTSIPVYDNQPITEIPKDDFDILIFTSPMNVDIYFENNEYNNQPIITIGLTTESAVKKYTNNKVQVAKEPSEESIAEELKNLLTKEIND